MMRPRLGIPVTKALGRLISDGAGSVTHDPHVGLYFNLYRVVILRAIFPKMWELRDGSWYATYLTASGPPFHVLRIDREFLTWHIESPTPSKRRTSGNSMRSLLAHLSGKDELSDSDLAALLGRAVSRVLLAKD